MKFRPTICAILLLAGVAAYAASPTNSDIAVLDPSGPMTMVQTTNAPDGSFVEAIITMDGQDMPVDYCGVCPTSGQAGVYFPQAGHNHRVVLRGPSGEVLAQAAGYVEGIECD